MKKFILFSIVSLSTLFSTAQCVADFTWSISGSIVQFTNTSVGTTTYTWSFGDGGYTALSNPSHTYTTGGSYDVCLVASYNDSMGGICADTICQQIFIQDSTGGNGCTGNASIYSNGAQIIGTNSSFGAYSFVWSVSDYLTGNQLTTETTTNLNYSPGYSGDFLVCLAAFDSLGFVCDTLCSVVFVTDSMSTGCTVDANIYSNVNQIVGINTSTGASIFSWNITDYNTGAFVTSANTPNLNYYPTYTGNFWVCLTAYDANGGVCDTICEVVAAVFDSLDSTASAAVISLNQFQLYPNPVNDVLNLKFDHLPSNSHALIVDLLGREMIQIDLETQVTEIHVSDLPRGMYMIQLIDSSSQIIGMQKFLRE